MTLRHASDLMKSEIPPQKQVLGFTCWLYMFLNLRHTQENMYSKSTIKSLSYRYSQ